MDTLIIDKIPILNKKKSLDTCVILPDSDFDLFYKAVLAIQQGSLVAFPTETVYGLGANALDPKAVSKIFEAKGRPSDNPLIVHVAGKQQIYPLVKKITEIAQILIDSLMPGPITLVFEKSNLIPGEVTAGLDTVAIRIPSHPVAHLFLEMAQIPVAAPSANVSGRPSTTTAKHVYADLKGKIPYIIDGGACDYGIESTVVDVTGDIPVILRPGTITAEQIFELCGSVSGIGSGKQQNREISARQNIQSKESKETLKNEINMPDRNLTNTDNWTNSYESALNQNTPGTPKSPGMKYRHYAPKAKVVLADGQDLARRIEIAKKLVRESVSKDKKTGVYGCNEMISAIVDDNFIQEICNLAIIKQNPTINADQQGLNQITQSFSIKKCLHTISYGVSGDIKGASAKLFAALREMDEYEVEFVVAEALPIKGVGVAYMNRLLKAAGINSKHEIASDSAAQSNNLEQNKYNENFDADSYLDSSRFFDNKIKHILFVCTGNTCRSPIAQGYFNYKCEKHRVECNADSAGISAFNGEPASNSAVTAMKELYGIDLSRHRSKIVTHDLIASADLVLTMTDSQRAVLLSRFPDESAKIFTITQYANSLTKSEINKSSLSKDIGDPYGQGISTYRQTAKHLAELIDIIIDKLFD